jgi:hypothetical protein
VFCDEHKAAEHHVCEFDHKTTKRIEMADAMPAVRGGAGLGVHRLESVDGSK